MHDRCSGLSSLSSEQRVERPSVSSDLGSDCEEILAGRPFYVRAGMSVSTDISTSWQGAPFIYGPVGKGIPPPATLARGSGRRMLLATTPTNNAILPHKKLPQDTMFSDSPWRCSTRKAVALPGASNRSRSMQHRWNEASMALVHSQSTFRRPDSSAPRS